jgi:2-dehydro-3-deoxygluconokinase
MFDVKPNAVHDLVIPTSMGLRLAPRNRQPVHAAQDFSLHVTSAESNVGSVASYLGRNVTILTALVRGSPLARRIRDDLAGRHMRVIAREVDAGGPWGHRHQINVADSGFGVRGPRVYNDRAGEVGRTLSPGDFDLNRIFIDEGARIVHTSGLFAALSPTTGELCKEIARAAKASGSAVSFDLNYRASLWEQEPERLRALFREIADYADILIGGAQEFEHTLGIPAADVRDMIAEAGKRHPGVSIFATTDRRAVTANEHRWGASIYADGQWREVAPRTVPVLDRIGGGDGFVGGLLYAILQGWDAERALHFGWASGALAVTMETDHAQPADEAQIWTIWEGDARVKR